MLQEHAVDIVRISVTERTARTPKKCTDCGRPIVKGQKYIRSIYKIDGEISTGISCTKGGWCALDEDPNY